MVTFGISYYDTVGDLQARHHWMGPFPCPTSSRLPGPTAGNRDTVFLELQSESQFMGLPQEVER